MVMLFPEIKNDPVIIATLADLVQQADLTRM